MQRQTACTLLCLQYYWVVVLQYYVYRCWRTRVSSEYPPPPLHLREMLLLVELMEHFIPFNHPAESAASQRQRGGRGGWRKVKERRGGGGGDERAAREREKERERERCGGDDRGEGSMEVKAQEWRAVRWKKAGRGTMTSWRVISANVELSPRFMDSWARVRGGRCRNMMAIKHPNEIWGKRNSLSFGPTHYSQHALGWWHAHFYKFEDQGPVLFAPSFRDVCSTFHHRDELIAGFLLVWIWYGTSLRTFCSLQNVCMCFWYLIKLFHGWMFALYRLLFIWAAPVKSADFWLQSEHATKISWFLKWSLV